jgi:homoserine kinase
MTTTGRGTTATPSAGRRVVVRVPATSANLGPGFDSFGLALGIHDEITVATAVSGVSVTVSGQGEDTLPTDRTHLVVRALQAGLAHAGAGPSGLRLNCRNDVPQGRGLGSSAAAVIGGLLAARGLLNDPGPLDDATVLRLATEMEGHPDNAAAALLGGFTVSWLDAEGPRTVAVPVHHKVRAVVCVPRTALATEAARGMLPASVPHADAAFTAARAGLLVHALSTRPELLMEATDDRLHQAQRAPAMMASVELMHRLRKHGAAAVISGAGPSVLVLGVGNGPAEVVRSVLDVEEPWKVFTPELCTHGATLTTYSG